MAIDQPNQDPQAEEAPRNFNAEAKAILANLDPQAAAAFLKEIRTDGRADELPNALLAKLQTLAKQAIPVEKAHIESRYPFPKPYRAPVAARYPDPREELAMPSYNTWSVNLGFRPNSIWAGLHSSNVNTLARRGMRGK